VTTTQDAAAKADIARSHTQEAAQDAKGRAAEVTGHASDAAHDVAGTAVEQAQQVKQETVRQARNLVSEATGQLSSQAGSQTQKLTGNLRELGDELRQMADSGSGGTASELVHQASERVHQVAGFLDGREPTEILDDVRRFARQRPGAFLAGAAALGLIAGRLGRGVKDASGSSNQGSSGSGSTGTSISPTPLTAPPSEVGSPDYLAGSTYEHGAMTTEPASYGSEPVDDYAGSAGSLGSEVPGGDIDLTQPYPAAGSEYGSELGR